MSSLNRFHIPGEWESAKKRAMLAGIGGACAYTGDSLYGNSTAVTVFAVGLFLVAGFLISAVFFGELLRRGKDGSESGAPFWIFLAVMGAMWFASWEVVTLAALAVSFMNNSTAQDRRFKDWGWYYIGALAFVVLAQFWLNTAILNTMGSDEDLIGNDRVQHFAPLISAVGFGVFAIRVFPVRGTSVVAVLLLAATSFYHLQTFVVDTWASAQSRQDQRLATTAYFGKIAALSQFPWMLSDDLQASPEKLRLSASLMPAKTVLSGDISQLETALNQAKPEHVLRAMRIEMIRPGMAQEKGRERLKRLRAGYEDYLLSYLLRLDNEATARNVAEKHYPALLKIQHEPLTRRSLADHVIEEVKAKLPASRRSAQGLQRTFGSQRNSYKLSRMLRDEGIHLEDGWRYTNVSGFRTDLMRSFMKASDKGDRLIASRAGASPLKTGSLQVEGKRFMTWHDYTMKVAGVSLPLGDTPSKWYGFSAFADDLDHMFKHSSTESLMNMVNTHLRGSTDSSLAMKAAIVPAAVVFASFGVMLLNLAALVYALWERYQSGIRHLAAQHTPMAARRFYAWLWTPHMWKLMLAGVALGLVISGGGPTSTYMKWQERVYSAGNAIFGGLATLSHYPAGHEHHEKLAVHHLSRAQALVNANSSMKYSFAYPNYHLEMAVYYDPRIKPAAKKLAPKMLQIFEANGADELGHKRYREYQRTKSLLRSTLGV